MDDLIITSTWDVGWFVQVKNVADDISILSDSKDGGQPNALALIISLPTCPSSTKL